LVIIPGSLIITNEIWNIIKTLKKKKSKGGKKIKNIIIVGYAIVAISAIVLGYTSSYFYDIEVSSGNILQAGTADIADHLVISEIHIRGTDDWIELYNPTNESINLSASKYRLERDPNGGDNNPTIVMRFGSSDDGEYPGGTVIPGHGYYLVLDNDSTNESLRAKADALVTRSFLLDDDDVIYLGTGPIDGPQDEDIVDFVGYGNPKSNTSEGRHPASAPDDKSIERKAQTSSTNTTMASGGVDEFNGNGQDTDDNSADFVLRENPQPQNSLSTPEKPPWPPK